MDACHDQAGLAADAARNVAAALQNWLATDNAHSMAKGLPLFCEHIQDDLLDSKHTLVLYATKPHMV